METQGGGHHILSAVHYFGSQAQLKPNDFIVNVERKLEGIVRSRLIVGAELKTAARSFGSYDVKR